MVGPSRSRRLLTLGSLALGCATPTQITLELTTNALCPGAPGQGDHLENTMIIGAPDLSGSDYVETTVTSQCTPSGSSSPNQIGTLVFVPADDNASRSLSVAIFAGVERPDGVTRKSSDQCRDLYLETGSIEGQPCILARRRLGFVDHAKLLLPVALDTRCVGVQCGEDQTCASGSCVDAAIACDEASGECDDPGGTGGGAGTGGAGTGAGMDVGGNGTGGSTSTTSTSTTSTSTTSTSTSTSTTSTSTSTGIGGSGATSGTGGLGPTTTGIGGSGATSSASFVGPTTTGIGGSGATSSTGSLTSTALTGPIPSAGGGTTLPVNLWVVSAATGGWAQSGPLLGVFEARSQRRRTAAVPRPLLVDDGLVSVAGALGDDDWRSAAIRVRRAAIDGSASVLGLRVASDGVRAEPLGDTAWMLREGGDAAIDVREPKLPRAGAEWMAPDGATFGLRSSRTNDLTTLLAEGVAVDAFHGHFDALAVTRDRWAWLGGDGLVGLDLDRSRWTDALGADVEIRAVIGVGDAAFAVGDGLYACAEGRCEPIALPPRLELAELTAVTASQLGADPTLERYELVIAGRRDGVPALFQLGLRRSTGASDWVVDDVAPLGTGGLGDDLRGVWLDRRTRTLWVVSERGLFALRVGRLSGATD